MPKLNHKARLTLFRFISNPRLAFNLTKNEHKRLIYSTLLVSHNFLDSFFNDKDEKNSDASLYLEEKIILKKQWKRYEFRLDLDPQHIAALILVSNVERVFVAFLFWNVNWLLVKKWMTVCRALKDSKTLKSIKIRVEVSDDRQYCFLLDLLPDKITDFLGGSNYLSFLAKRKALMESLNVRIQDYQTNYALLFKIKSRQIGIAYNYNSAFWELAESGPFPSNSYIEKMKLPVQLGFYQDKNKQICKCENIFMGKYKTALEYLKRVNPGMSLDFHNFTNFGKLSNKEEGQTMMDELIENTKTFIELVNEVEMQVEFVILSVVIMRIVLQMTSTPKRLRCRCRYFFWEHYNTFPRRDDQIYIMQMEYDDKIKFFKSLIISREWAKDFFCGPENKPLDMCMNFATVEFGFNDDRWGINVLYLKVMNVLMKLIDLTDVKIFIMGPFELEKKEIQEVFKFCRILKDSKTLRSIDIWISPHEETYQDGMIGYLQMISDLLPKDKIKELKCMSPVAVCFKKHLIEKLIITDTIENFWDTFKQVDKLNILRMKAKSICIDECKKDYDYFNIFGNKSFYNPIIEELYLPLRFILCCSNYHESREEWIEEYSPQFEAIFKKLAIFHPNLKLTLLVDAGKLYKLDNQTETVEIMMENASWCLQTIIDWSINFGLKIEKIILKWSITFCLINAKFQLGPTKSIRFRIVDNSMIDQEEEYKDTVMSYEMTCYNLFGKKRSRSQDPLFKLRKRK